MEMKPMDDGLDSFQDKLEEYNRNFERLSEVLGEQSLTEAGATKAVRVEHTKNLLAEALPIAVRTVISLAAGADSESVRYNAAKLLIDISLGKDPGLQTTDPAQDLIARLTGATSEADDGG